MEYDDDFLKKMVQLGTLAYPVSKIINILDIENTSEFIKHFDDPKHPIQLNYKKGIDKSDFVLDNKLFEMAKNGNLKAIEKYEEKKRIYIYNERDEKRNRK